jgi:hypothetical protein
MATRHQERVYAYGVDRIRGVSALPMARDPRDVYIREAGKVTPIVVGGDEEVCASGGIRLGRMFAVVFDAGRGGCV